jgi:lipid A 3-O-deacylase
MYLRLPLAAAAILLPVSLARAEPPADPNATLTFQIENDSTNPHSDQYYTSGLRFGYTSPTGAVPQAVATLGHDWLGAGQQRWAFDLSQQLFTAHFTGNTIPPLNDRPYAAILMGTFSLIQDTDTTRTVLAAGLGVIGPAALGREVQNGFHSFIGQGDVHGWGTQMSNQPVVQLTAERTWRTAAARAGSLEIDMLPELTVSAGSYRIYGQAGGTLRIGQGLASDFGPARIRPGLTGTDAYVATQPFAWYAFIGADGQAVAWDETLDGLPFASSRHVSRTPMVGELQGGLAVMAYGMRVTASHTLRTHEFSSQRAGLFQFSSLALSVKF